MNHVASKFANLVWAVLVLGAFVAPRLAQSASMRQAVVAPGNAIAGNLLYCFGGSNNGAVFQGTVYNNVQIYRP